MIKLGRDEDGFGSVNCTRIYLLTFFHTRRSSLSFWSVNGCELRLAFMAIFICQASEPQFSPNTQALGIVIVSSVKEFRMKRTILGVTLTACASWLAAHPSGESPKFAAADVHVSAKTTGPMNEYVRTGPVRAGRFEIRKGTMVDLIHIAYEYDSDKILGGPKQSGGGGNFSKLNRDPMNSGQQRS
jgi:hypothetical protein